MANKRKKFSAEQKVETGLKPVSTSASDRKRVGFGHLRPKIIIVAIMKIKRRIFL